MIDIEKIRAFFKADEYAMGVTGITIDEVGERYAVCSLEPNGSHANAGGAVQGGAIYTLADFCFAVAANGAAISDGAGAGTITLSADVSYLRPAKIGAKLTAAAQCVKNGRNVCCYEVRVTDPEGKIAAIVLLNGFVGGK